MTSYDRPVFGFSCFDAENDQQFFYTGKIGRECFSTDKSLALTNMTLDEVMEEIKMAKELGYLTNESRVMIIDSDLFAHFHIR